MQSDNSAAVLLCRTPHGNLHAGLIFRNDVSAEVLHLAWENQLQNQWPWTRFWAAPEIDPARLFSIAALCRRIWATYSNRRQMPYGLVFEGSRFDSSGNFVLSATARGLTCATFILAVFKHFGIDLVDEDSWPIRTEEDQEFLNVIRSWADPVLFQALEREVHNRCRRIRPDEVTGACAFTPPCRFFDARTAADEAVDRLDNNVNS